MFGTHCVGTTGGSLIVLNIFHILATTLCSVLTEGAFLVLSFFLASYPNYPSILYVLVCHTFYTYKLYLWEIKSVPYSRRACLGEESGAPTQTCGEPKLEGLTLTPQLYI